MELELLIRDIRDIGYNIFRGKSNIVRNKLIILRNVEFTSDSLLIPDSFGEHVKNEVLEIGERFHSGNIEEAESSTTELMGFVEAYKQVEQDSLEGLVDEFENSAQRAYDNNKSGRQYIASLHERYIIGAAQGARLAINHIYPKIRNVGGNNIMVGDREVKLTDDHSLLLTYFLGNSYRVLSEQKIGLDVWNGEKTDRDVRELINNLNRKLQSDRSLPQFINLYWGEGYVFSPIPQRPPKLEYDEDERTVTMNGFGVGLSVLEGQLFEYFYARRREIIPKDKVKQALWENEPKDINLEHRFNSTLNLLNQKLAKYSGQNLIVNVRNQGYVYKS